jgi:hypothetical protein
MRIVDQELLVHGGGDRWAYQGAAEDARQQQVGIHMYMYIYIYICHLSIIPSIHRSIYISSYTRESIGKR